MANYKKVAQKGTQMKNFNIGFISALFFLMLIAFTCSKEETPVVPPTKGSVKGTVIDNKSEKGIANAIIYTEPGSFQVTTDSYGDYRMNNVEPADYKVFCYKPGYDTVTTSIKVVAGVESPANFRLTAKDTANGGNGAFGTIKGIVTDFNSEIPIEKVSIKTFPPTSVTSTGSDGKFVISNVTGGNYKVVATKKDYDSSFVNIVVSSGNITEANLSITKVNALDTTQLGKIRGKVSDVATSKPIANAIVFTDPSSNSVITDANGEFLINHIKPATYKVIAQRNEYINDTTSVVVQKNITSVANLTMKAVGNTLGNIKGRVIDKISNAPVSNVTVFTVPSSSSVLTDSKGDYVISNINPNTYKVIAKKYDYLSDTTEVVVKANLDVIGNLSIKTSYGSLEGTVVTEGNSPVKNATLRTEPSTNILRTGNNGEYKFERLDPGAYKIITSAVDFKTDTTSVIIKAGVKTLAPIILKR